MRRTATRRTVLAAFLMAMMLAGPLSAAEADIQTALDASIIKLLQHLQNINDMTTSLSELDYANANHLLVTGETLSDRIDTTSLLLELRSGMRDRADRAIVQLRLVQRMQLVGKDCERVRKSMNESLGRARSPALVSAGEKLRDELATGCALVQTIK
jgi:hypothetical protein